MPLLNRITQWVCRLLLGLTFVFSGFVKGVDPWGTAYKIQDYFTAFNLESFSGWALWLSIALSATELLLGLLLLFAQLRRVSFYGIAVMMLIFTPVTLYLAIANPVSDCGCFGDAIKLTNWETFGKNLILLLAVVLLFLCGWTKRQSYANNHLKYSHLLLLLFALFPPVYALRHLPMLDFRPYAVGVNIPEAMQIPPDAPKDVYITTFVYEKNGERKTFDETNYPWDDSTWVFVSNETTLVEQGYRPPIAEFILKDIDQQEMTDRVINDPGAVLLVVAPFLSDISKAELTRIESIVEGVARPRQLPIYLLTSSPLSEVAERLGGLPPEVVPLAGDERVLKTVVRAHPGVVLLSGGTILGKWTMADFPQRRFEAGNVSSQQIRALAREGKRGLFLAMGVVFLLLAGGYIYTAGRERGWLSRH